MNKKNIVVKNLNEVFALLVQYALEARLAHWNIVGPSFLSLHELFGSVYESADKNADDVAERLRYLQVQVDFSDVHIPVGYEVTNQNAVLSRLIDLSEMLSSGLGEAIASISEIDPASQDMLIDIQREIDDFTYHLRSHV